MAVNHEGIDHDPMTHDFVKSQPGLQSGRPNQNQNRGAGAGLAAGSVSRSDDDVTREMVTVDDAAGIVRKSTPAGVGNSDLENGEGPLTPM